MNILDDLDFALDQFAIDIDGFEHLFPGCVIMVSPLEFLVQQLHAHDFVHGVLILFEIDPQLAYVCQAIRSLVHVDAFGELPDPVPDDIQGCPVG